MTDLDINLKRHVRQVLFADLQDMFRKTALRNQAQLGFTNSFQITWFGRNMLNFSQYYLTWFLTFRTQTQKQLVLKLNRPSSLSIYARIEGIKRLKIPHVRHMHFSFLRKRKLQWTFEINYGYITHIPYKEPLLSGRMAISNSTSFPPSLFAAALHTYFKAFFTWSGLAGWIGITGSKLNS